MANNWLSAFKKLFSEDNIIPFSEEETRQRGNGFYYKGKSFLHYNKLPYDNMAFFRISILQLELVNLFLFFTAIGIFINFHLTIVFFLAIIICFYILDSFCNLFFVSKSFIKSPEITIDDILIKQIENREWLVYTILCPLYKEWEVLSQFIIAMRDIDYPKDKLQVLLLLEEDDKESIKRINEFSLPFYFQTIIVPDSLPKTKPKALNYGLLFSKGEYIVVYDAEDIPDPLQLKKVVLAFEHSSEQTACIQAKLHFYNIEQNLITRLFTAEYSLWFDLVLTGLQSINGPIPLGGSSNHFKLEIIKQLHGWDAFNVTEDCDLGMRLMMQGMHTAIINSTTNEEANSKTKNWLEQRSRWIKGYLQTYSVHMRNPQSFIRRGETMFSPIRESEQGRLQGIAPTINLNFLIFQIVVGGKIFFLFMNPLMWILTLIYFTFRQTLGTTIESFFPVPILYLGVTSLILGNFFFFYSYMLAAAKRQEFYLIKYIFLVPVYWVMMSTAAWMALYSFLTKPHYWAKTKHGYHLGQRQEFEATEEQIRQYPVEGIPAY